MLSLVRENLQYAPPAEQYARKDTRRGRSVAAVLLAPLLALSGCVLTRPDDEPVTGSSADNTYTVPVGAKVASQPDMDADCGHTIQETTAVADREDLRALETHNLLGFSAGKLPLNEGNTCPPDGYHWIQVPPTPQN